MNAPVFVTEPALDEVTTRSTRPAACAPVVPVICVEVTVSPLTATPPRVTLVTFAKFDPTIAMLVPPSVEPLDGLTEPRSMGRT